MLYSDELKGSMQNTVTTESYGLKDIINIEMVRIIFTLR